MALLEFLSSFDQKEQEKFLAELFEMVAERVFSRLDDELPDEKQQELVAALEKLPNQWERLLAADANLLDYLSPESLANINRKIFHEELAGIENVVPNFLEIFVQESTKLFEELDAELEQRLKTLKPTVGTA